MSAPMNYLDGNAAAGNKGRHHSERDRKEKRRETTQ
jgi:hypothetical protein